MKIWGNAPHHRQAGNDTRATQTTTQDIDARSARKNSGEGRKGCFVRAKGAWLNPYENGEGAWLTGRPNALALPTLWGVGGRWGRWGRLGAKLSRRSKEGNEVSPPFTLRARRNGRATTRGGPANPHTQHSGADLGVRSGADDLRRQFQKSGRPPPPVRPPKKFICTNTRSAAQFMRVFNLFVTSAGAMPLRLQIDVSRRLADARRATVRA